MKLLLVFAFLIISIQVIAKDMDTELEISSDCHSVAQCEMNIVDGVAAVMIAKFQNSWKQSEALKSLSVELKVTLARDGSIDEIQWIQQSEDKAYNQSIVDALNAVFPLSEIELLNDELFEQHFKENVFSFGD